MIDQNNLTIDQTLAWQALGNHWKYMSQQHMRDLFATDPQRYENFSLSACGLHLDYSKNLIDKTTLKLLLDLAKEAELTHWAESLLAGDEVNTTEGRAVLHMALRNPGDRHYQYKGRDVMPDILSVLSRMRNFSEEVRKGTWLGYTGQRITHVVSIGIGGSSLGPRMVCGALEAYQQDGGLKVHFVSNLDGTHLQQTLRGLEPATTLFVIASKTFSTQETKTNAKSAREWLLDSLQDDEAIKRHFVAVSTNTKAVVEFGIDPKNMFEFWDWVGGRYSLWSAIGLPIALAIGMDNFEELLLGAHDMDEHFLVAPPETNMPIILALLGVWYINFGNAHSHAIVPYSQYLMHFPAYMQQLDMESNGKRVTREGKPVDYHTAPVVWGYVGTDAQHSFFQLLHQGTGLVPCDLILPMETQSRFNDHHDKLVANCLAQSQALMHGRKANQARTEMEAAELPETQIEALLPHRIFEGNRPTNTIIMDQLTPRTLGALIALYEYKVFVQGVIWGVDSFDQWGVELGKKLAGQILDSFQESESACPVGVDSSTAALMERYRLSTNGKNK